MTEAEPALRTAYLMVHDQMERGFIPVIADPLGLSGIYPIAVSPDGTGVWLGSYQGSDRLRLARLDVATGEETEVDSHPTLDLGAQLVLPSPFITSERTGELIGARYYGER